LLRAVAGLEPGAPRGDVALSFSKRAGTEGAVALPRAESSVE
jgi:hypothetical protein